MGEKMKKLMYLGIGMFVGMMMTNKDYMKPIQNAMKKMNMK